MTERDATGATIHWVGTGLSTGSGLNLLANRPENLVIWGRTAEKASACAARLDLPPHVGARRFTIADLTAELAPGDVVVSMLPATEHPSLLRMCIDRRAHFACTSYTTSEIKALSASACDRGIVVLTEAGLDPGIDHILAHVLLARAREELRDGPGELSLTSYCGGLPAVPNDFRYRFSWAPRGVLTALLSPARYIEAGAEKSAKHPWNSVQPRTVGDEEFEVYPNRDSVPYIEQYGIPANWQVQDLVRGTLRLSGWKSAWAEIFTALEARGPAGVDDLAANLARRYPTTPSDRDRVVLAVELRVRAAGGKSWSGRHVLDLVGDDKETAMALCVSTPLAIGVSRILDGALPAGLNRGAETVDEARLWLEELERNGITPGVNELSSTSAVASA